MLSENRRKIIAEDEAWSDEIPCAIDEETTAIDGSNGIYQKIMNRIFKVKNLLYNRRIITGSGMTGGGNLSTDVNLDVKRTSDPTGIATDTCLTQSGGKTIWDKALEVLGLTNTNKAAILNNKEQIENLMSTFASNGYKFYKFNNGFMIAKGYTSIPSATPYTHTFTEFVEIFNVSPESKHPTSLQYFATCVDGTTINAKLASASSQGHSSMVTVFGRWK